ncbi:hypothetical protein TYRP_013218 [Tyrophagus putrescentiae]|nr:hypothetical protein TYRP_013218 [Tyrophagus putrescentiae]
MDPTAYAYFTDRLEVKKQVVKEKIDELITEMFCNMVNDFSRLAEVNKKEKEANGDGGVSSAGVALQGPGEMGSCVETINSKIHYMLIKTYEEAFTDYEQGMEYAKEASNQQQQQQQLQQQQHQQQQLTEDGGELILFETTQVKKRKRNKGVETDDRALVLMNKMPKAVQKSFYCKWPDCGHSSKNFYNLAKHVRHNHFSLPVTKQEQDELKIVDKRDPLKFVGELTEQNPHREVVQPTEEDLYQPKYERRKKYICKYINCGRAFSEKQVLVGHEKLHLGLKPFRCGFDKSCPFSSLKRTAVRRHIRQKHFKLPKTLKKQMAMSLIDDRDPDMYIVEDPNQNQIPLLFEVQQN